ncbi:MAG: hypothetical protein Q9196_005027, partial [Gyalolechia fulgens]
MASTQRGELPTSHPLAFSGLGWFHFVTNDEWTASGLLRKIETLKNKGGQSALILEFKPMFLRIQDSSEPLTKEDMSLFNELHREMEKDIIRNDIDVLVSTIVTGGCSQASGFPLDHLIVQEAGSASYGEFLMAFERTDGEPVTAHATGDIKQLAATSKEHPSQNNHFANITKLNPFYRLIQMNRSHAQFFEQNRTFHNLSELISG